MKWQRVSFSVPVPNFGLLGALNRLRRSFDRRNLYVDSVPRSFNESPLAIDSAEYVAFDCPLDLCEPAPRDAKIEAGLKRLLSKIDSPIAIALPSDLSLTRAVRLPLVGVDKLQSIMDFEARQQFPFALDNLVWSWARCSGSVEEGTAYDHDCIMVAARRESLHKFLQPFISANLRKKIDLVQPRSVLLADYIATCHINFEGTLMEEGALEKYILGVNLARGIGENIFTNGDGFFSRNLDLNERKGEVAKRNRASANAHLETKSSTDEFECMDEDTEIDSSVMNELSRVFIEDHQTKRLNPTQLGEELVAHLGKIREWQRNAKVSGVTFFGNDCAQPGVKEAILEQLKVPEIRIPLGGSMVKRGTLNYSTVRSHGRLMAPAIAAAMQRLGVGRYRTNLCPGENAFGISKKTTSAWGIDVQLEGIAAVRLSRV